MAWAGTLYKAPLGTARRAQRLADLGHRYLSPQDPVGVDRDHAAEAPQALALEQLLQRLMLVDAHCQVLLEHVAHLQGRAPGGDLRVNSLGAHHAQEVAGGGGGPEPTDAG